MTTNTQTPADHRRDDARPATVGGFNLHALVREIVAEHDSPDPQDIAATVMRRIPKKEHAGIVELLLHRYVGDVVRAARKTSSAPTSVAATPMPQPSGRSRKVAAIREACAWRRQRIHVGGGVWKFKADCTYDDLMAAAAERRALAAANVVEAERFEAEAALVKHHGVTTLGECSDDEVIALEERAA